MSKHKDGCSGKIRHKTRDGACINKAKIGKPGMNVYHCRICGGWHVGKTRDPGRSADRITYLLEQHEKRYK